MLFLSAPRFSGRVLLAATLSLPASGSLWNGTAPSQGHSSLPPTATPVPQGPGCRGDPGAHLWGPSGAGHAHLHRTSRGFSNTGKHPFPSASPGPRATRAGHTGPSSRCPVPLSLQCQAARSHGPTPLRTPVLLRQGQQDAACFLSHPAGVLQTPVTGRGWKTWSEARLHWSRAAGTGNIGATSPIQPALHPPLTLREEAWKGLFLQQGVSLAIQIPTQRLPGDVQLPWIWRAGYSFLSLPRAWNIWEAR